MLRQWLRIVKILFEIVVALLENAQQSLLLIIEAT